MTIKQISVFVENRAGRLAEITGILSRAEVDIRAFSIADTTDFGILRLIVNQPEKAMAALKAEDMTVSTTDVVAVKLADKPGALYEILQVLSDKNISVEYGYAFIAQSHNSAYTVLRVEDNAAAITALQSGGIEILAAKEVYGL